MTVQAPPPDKMEKFLHAASWAAVGIGGGLFLVVSPEVGMRWLGLFSIVYAALVVIRRRLPGGGEGYITGSSAAVLGLLWGGLGLAMLTRPEAMLRFLGWA